MVNWILNSEAPETLKTYSRDEIWVMADCYFGVGARRDALRD